MNITENEIKNVQEEISELVNQISAVFLGKNDIVEIVVGALISGGHVLLEDLPGTGKTLLAKTIAKNIRGESARIQFTPDLLPSDILGISIYDQLNRRFSFRKGPIFANVVLADEINRTSAKTQSALLEAMEENQVTVDGETRELPNPFFVIATDNPIENLGTYQLPEAQLDRFMVKISVGKISDETALKIVLRGDAERKNDEKDNANDTSLKQILTIRKQVQKVFVSESVAEYILEILKSISENDSVEFGSSIRGALAIKKISQFFAALDGRNFVTPDDVKKVTPFCLNHRIILKSDAKFLQKTTFSVIEETLEKVAVPK